ncbi:MAG: ABC transporter permease [Gammaproteobacteria bacterium]|nr:ABC transporter permease [Gammaproteobacteria bacterium]
MNRFTLITTNLWRKPTRTSLTLISLVVAFLLFMLLRAITTAISGGVTVAGAQRLIVDAKYSMTDNLPIAYVRAMREMPGVLEVTQMVWFGGYYQDPQVSFTTVPVDHTRYFDVFPEAVIAADVLERFHQSKRAVVAHESLVATYGWSVGDVIGLQGDIWPKEDGSWDWEFVLAGSYGTGENSRLPKMFLLRHDYFNESVADWVKDQVGWAVVRLQDQADAQSVIAAIDGRFENSSDPTKSMTENAYSQESAKAIGDISLIASMILGAVFFTIVLLTANVIGLAFRERIPELATLKTLGFKDGFVSALVLVESMTLCIAGAALGIGLAFALEPYLKNNLESVLGYFEMSWLDAGQAMAIAAVLGIAVGALPALRARRMSIADALREAV